MHACLPHALQVFEYLTTDLKKYMDRNGKGPNFPLPKTTIKVSRPAPRRQHDCGSSGSSSHNATLVACTFWPAQPMAHDMPGGRPALAALRGHLCAERASVAPPAAFLQSMLYQLIKGLAHCHKHGVMHRDLKPQNLLVDDQSMTLKIADLGLGRAFSIPVKSYTHEVGS